MIQAVVALAVALIMAVWLGRLYRPHAGGLTESDTREVLVMIGFVSVLFMHALGRTVNPWLENVLTMMLGYFFGAAMPRVKQAQFTAETQRPQSLESAKSGRASLPLLILCALSASAVLLILPACVTIEAAQDFTDNLAAGVGVDAETVNKGRVAAAKVEAKRAGMQVVPTNAVILPATATPFAKELREIGTDRLIESGVYSREVYEVRTVLAAAPTPTAPPPAPKIENRQSEIENSSNSGATTFPSGKPGAVIPPVVAPSLTVAETRIYTVQARVTNAAGAIAASVTGATATATVTITGADGWTTNGGAVTLAGRVQSLEGVPPGIDLAALVWSNVPASVSGGVVAASSATNADVMFQATASLNDGRLVARALPKVGTAAGAFLQSLDLEGAAILISSDWKTNAAEITAEAQRPQSLDAIPADQIEIIGKHKMSPAKAAPSARLHSAKIEGGNVRLSFDPLGWPTQSSKGKTVDGGVIIVWQSGGKFVGGWFDHHGQGQKVKTLSNIFGGYVDGRQPPPGPVWFYLISYSGRERSNIVRSSNDWK